MYKYKRVQNTKKKNIFEIFCGKKIDFFSTRFLSEINKIVPILRVLSVDYDLIRKSKDFDINLILIR